MNKKSLKSLVFLQVCGGSNEEKRGVPTFEGSKFTCKSSKRLFFNKMFLLCIETVLPWTAGVCECVLLVHPAKSEREGKKCRLPEQAGKGAFLFQGVVEE